MNYAIQISKRGKPIVEIDNFTLPEDKIILLFGESGIGKSILTRAVYGLLDPDELDVVINGQDYREYLHSATAENKRENGFFVFQEPSSHLNPLMQIRDQLREGALSAAENEDEILKQLWDSTTSTAAQKLLDIYPRPYRPSGGEKQRMLLAMAFKKISVLKEGQKGELFVFDEPSGSLDNNFRNIFLSMLLNMYRSRPFSGLIITHDYSMISELYSTHADLKDQIAFKELRRDENLTMVDFDPSAYLQWLGKAEMRSIPTSSHNEPLLHIDSSYSVFGKKMSILKQDASTPTSLTIYPGQIAYIKAASRVGKTTLAKIVMGLTSPEKVRLNICGLEINEKTPAPVWRQKVWGKKAGMVFQHADEALNLNASVEDVFAGLPSDMRISDAGLRKHMEEWYQMTI
ncbi:MAG: ATP-binding cassette domain-containing protein, partial [Calditrichota bacterium]